MQTEEWLVLEFLYHKAEVYLNVDSTGPASSPSNIAGKVAVFNYQVIGVSNLESVHADTATNICASVAFDDCSVDNDLVLVRHLVERNEDPSAVEPCYVISDDRVLYYNLVIACFIERCHNSPTVSPGDVEIGSNPKIVQVLMTDVGSVVDESTVFNEHRDRRLGVVPPQKS